MTDTATIALTVINGSTSAVVGVGDPDEAEALLARALAIIKPADAIEPEPEPRPRLSCDETSDILRIIAPVGRENAWTPAEAMRRIEAASREVGYSSVCASLARLADAGYLRVAKQGRNKVYWRARR